MASKGRPAGPSTNMGRTKDAEGVSIVPVISHSPAKNAAEPKSPDKLHDLHVNTPAWGNGSIALPPDVLKRYRLVPKRYDPDAGFATRHRLQRLSMLFFASPFWEALLLAAVGMWVFLLPLCLDELAGRSYFTPYLCCNLQFHSENITAVQEYLTREGFTTANKFGASPLRQYLTKLHQMNADTQCEPRCQFATPRIPPTPAPTPLPYEPPFAGHCPSCPSCGFNLPTPTAPGASSMCNWTTAKRGGTTSLEWVLQRMPGDSIAHTGGTGPSQGPTGTNDTYMFLETSLGWGHRHCCHSHATPRHATPRHATQCPST